MDNKLISSLIKSILDKKNREIYTANKDSYQERLQAILDAKQAVKSRKTGLTLKDIIFNTRKTVKDKANKVGVQFYKKIIKPRYKHYFFKARTKEPGKYTRLVEILLKGNPQVALEKSKAYVSCSCEDFLFTCEVALKEKDASQIIYSNGEKPRIKNPKMIPCACKHIVAVYRYLLHYNFKEDKKNAEKQLQELIKKGKVKKIIKSDGKSYYRFL